MVLRLTSVDWSHSVVRTEEDSSRVVVVNEK